MPELPEVELVARYLRPLLIGRKIQRVHTSRPSYFFLTAPEILQRCLPGETVMSLERCGKYLVATLKHGQRLLLHLGMTGQLIVQGSLNDESKGAPLTRDVHGAGNKPARDVHGAGNKPARDAHGAGNKPARDAHGAGNKRARDAHGAGNKRAHDAHTHLVIEFADHGPDVLFRDTRKFGKVRLLDPDTSEPRLDKLGPDALAVTAEHLFGASRKRRVKIKSFLLDQTVLAGVGNIYADESLFLAQIHPERQAQSLTQPECARLSQTVRRVLRRSIELGGSSIEDYIHPDGSAGAFQQEFRVYGRDGEPCPRCKTAIERVVIGQRSSHFCPKCQR